MATGTAYVKPLPSIFERHQYFYDHNASSCLSPLVIVFPPQSIRDHVPMVLLGLIAEGPGAVLILIKIFNRIKKKFFFPFFLFFVMVKKRKNVWMQKYKDRTWT